MKWHTSCNLLHVELISDCPHKRNPSRSNSRQFINVNYAANKDLLPDSTKKRAPFIVLFIDFRRSVKPLACCFVVSSDDTASSVSVVQLIGLCGTRT